MGTIVSRYENYPKENPTSIVVGLSLKTGNKSFYLENLIPLSETVALSMTEVVERCLDCVSIRKVQEQEIDPKTKEIVKPEITQTFREEVLAWFAENENKEETIIGKEIVL